MLARVSILLILLSSCQSLKKSKLKDGDIIFQNLDCGDLCDAIESVTYGKNGLNFSHLGLFFIQNGENYILESIGSGVIQTPLDSFLLRTKNQHYVGRPDTKTETIKSALIYGIEKLGTPYDDDFIYNNGKYYCSELIYDCFLKGGHDSIFSLEPMTFQSASDANVKIIWDKYYSELQVPVPEGQLGINPAGMSRSSSLKWLKKIKN